MNARRTGFTLLDLLICVTLIGMLATLAVPGYRHVVRRAHRGDAQQALLRVQALQERHYFEHGRYAGTLAALQDAATSGAAPADRSEAGLYVLALQARADGQGYVAWAQPAPGGGQVDDTGCIRLSIDETGRRLAQGGDDAARRCWG